MKMFYTRTPHYRNDFQTIEWRGWDGKQTPKMSLQSLEALGANLQAAASAAELHLDNSMTIM